jgi:hypothetical protein
LAAIPGLTVLSIEGNGFTARVADPVQALRSLVERGLAVASAEPVDGHLEEFYFRHTGGEA